MKKKYFLSALLCGVLATAANAQITVTRAHLVVTNQKVVQAVDYSTYPALAAPGANKTWDYSNLVSDNVDTITFGNADWYPGYQNFPNANMGAKNSSDDSSVTFLRVDNTQLSFEGAYDWSSMGGSTTVHQKLLQLPATYNSTWNDSTTFTSDAFYIGQDPPGPIPMIDSGRVTITSKSNAVINGWGTLKTPLGDFPTLMVSITRTNKQSYEMYTSGMWIKPPAGAGFDDTITTEYQKMWWTNDATVGFPLMEYTYYPGDTTTNEVQWLKVKPATSGTDLFSVNGLNVYPNPATSALHVSAVAATSVRISDLMGKVVLNALGNEQFNLDISSLRSAVYSVSVYRNNDLIGTEKLIKK